APVGQNLTNVSIKGFAPNDVVDIKFDSQSGKTVKTFTMNGSGNLSGVSIPVPYPFPGGMHWLYGVGASGIVGKGTATVTAVAHLDPSAVKAGQAANLIASGFIPNENVTAWFPYGPQLSQKADSTGSVLIPMVSPEEPFMQGIVTVQAPSGTVEAP